MGRDGILVQATRLLVELNMESAPRLLVTGASGHLGSYLRAELARRRGPQGQHLGQALEGVTFWGGPNANVSDGERVDLLDTRRVERLFAQADPQAIIHAAAMSRVDQCHENRELAHQINADATSRLTTLAENHGARILFVSTDLVFDGTSPPYSEDASPHPLSVYGKTKRLGEEAVLLNSRGLVARISLLFGPGRNGRRTFFDQQRETLIKHEPCRLFADEWRSPLSFAMAARVLCRLAISEQTGVVHVGGPERMSRLEMGERLARYFGISLSSITPIRQNDLATPEPRPRDVSLDSHRVRSWFPRLRWARYEESLAELFPGEEPPGRDSPLEAEEGWNGRDRP